MEGDRQWAFTAPAFGCSIGSHVPQGAPSLASGARYCPAGWHKRRKHSKNQSRSKRHKVQAAAAAESAAAAAQAIAPGTGQPLAASARGAPANPAQLVPLRCIWPHPAVLDLLIQQCWPAAGAAALVQRTAVPQLGRQPNWWNRMLPSLSLLHSPLTPELQVLLAPAQQNATASSSGRSDCVTGGIIRCGGTTQAVTLPRPNILVGYQEDWLEVAPEVLPLWAATPLAPFAGPKPLLHCLVCPQQQLAQAQQFIKDVGSLYETCNLGSHLPATGAAVHAFQLGQPPAGAAAATQQAAGAWRALPLAQRYLAGLRHACEQLQRQLLLEPPEELQQQQQQGSKLEDGAEPAVLVYVACPLEQQGELVAALLEAAACLAPCTPLGAGAGAGSDACLLQEAQPASGFTLAGSGQHPLAPTEPQPPDRPAGATPGTDSSRAPGGSPPPGEQPEDARQQQQQEEKEHPLLRYHGASQLLHQQQQGDYRQLPVRLVQRSQGSRPIRIVLQVLSPQALGDISGTAARCTAFALYNKVQHVPADGQEQSPAALPGAAGPAELPFSSQPLMVLAPAPAGAQVAPAAAEAAAAAGIAAQSAAQDVQQPPLPPEDGGHAVDGGSGGGSSGAPSLSQRTLHCFYSLPSPGSSLLPLAFADSYGELLHAELLDTAAGSLLPGSLGLAASSSESLAAVAAAAAAAAGASSRCPSRTPANRACRLVLRRCLDMLALLRSASNPPNLLSSVAIASSGMQAAERQAWQQLVEQDPALMLEVPPGAELAVLELEALPPARYAGPEPPSGCKLLRRRGAGGSDGPGAQAAVTWLPPADGTSSLLPQEHDTVRSLQLELVARCQPDDLPMQPSRAREDSLCSLACELHGLGWLHAAFQGACLRSVGGGGQVAPPDTHLPLHAALAVRLQSLVQAVSVHATSG